MSPFNEQCEWMDDMAGINKPAPHASLVMALKAALKQCLIDFKTFYDVRLTLNGDQVLDGVIATLRVIAGLIFMVPVYDIAAVNGLLPDVDPVLQVAVIVLQHIGDSLNYLPRT